MRAFWHLCLAMPDPMIFLALAGTTGLAVQLTRLMELAAGHSTRITTGYRARAE